MTRGVAFLLLLLFVPAARPCSGRLAVEAVFSAGMNEKDMVAAALHHLKSREELNAPDKAALWRELAAAIAGRVGQPVSRGFLSDGTYVFQGERAVKGGKRYLLVITGDGRAYTGLSDPIADISLWSLDLDALHPL